MPSNHAQQDWIRKLVTAVDAVDDGPSATDLTEAPSLNYWRPLVSSKWTPVLWGIASGHPSLRSDYITTSPLVGINTAKGWARTASRWYVLKSPFAELEADVARSLGISDARTGFMEFELPGFRPLDDLTLLANILDERVNRIRLAAAEVG